MKRRLNILCLLVFLVFCYSVFNMGRDFGHGFSEGMKISHSGNQSVEQAINFRIATLMPKDFSSFKDSVYNEKTGSYVPVAYTQMVTNVKVDRSTWMMVAQVISGLLAVFAIIASTVLFIQLIVAINKSDIFNWKNVRRLRWLGVALLLNFISEAVPALMNDYELSSVFSLSGYSMETSITAVSCGRRSACVTARDIGRRPPPSADRPPSSRSVVHFRWSFQRLHSPARWQL